MIVEKEGERELIAPGLVNRKCSTTAGPGLQGGTAVNPDSKTIILAVANILHNILLEDTAQQKGISPESDLYQFSEEYYFGRKADFLTEDQVAMLRAVPSIENMFEFVKTFKECAHFGTECCIIALILINRFFNSTGAPLLACNWRPLMLCALMLAQKVWEDKNSTLTTDYAYIYPFFSNAEIGLLEQRFLSLINYNLHIKKMVYVQYYF
jgi:hypothetical protein